MEMTVKLTGLSTLLISNDRMADKLDHYSREMKRLTDIKKKTDETLHEIARCEWEGRLVMGTDGPCVRGQQVWRSIVEGARFTKAGRDVERGVQVHLSSSLSPILYDGPRDVDGMWADGRFADRRTVKVGTQRVVRVRPCWQKWEVVTTFLLHTEVIEADDVMRYAAVAGELVGIGDARRIGCGRYMVERVA